MSSDGVRWTAGIAIEGRCRCFVYGAWLPGAWSGAGPVRSQKDIEDPVNTITRRI